MNLRVILAFLFAHLVFTLSAQTDAQLEKDIQSTLQTLCNGAHAVLPADSRLDKWSKTDQHLVLFLHIRLSFLQNDFDELAYEDLIEHFGSLLEKYQLVGLSMRAKSKQDVYVELSDFLEMPKIDFAGLGPDVDPVPGKKGRLPLGKNRGFNTVQPDGFLSGKTVWLSAGHGWQHDHRHKEFVTQRHNTYGVVEDFATAEFVNYHLLKYLYNAGADVWTVRERDMNSNEVIIDNDMGAPYYKEEGPWAVSRSRGFKGGTYRYTLSGEKETARAIYTPRIPEDGWYWVSVRYRAGLNRSVDVRYIIQHAGGESIANVNQEIHGDTWVYLGQFYFEKNGKASVSLCNESTEFGQAIIADAIRFGGGVGDWADCRSGRTSGQPRFEEGAKYYAQFQGYPHCHNDVIVRPLYAEYQKAKSGDRFSDNSIYVSIHTNASKASGTETFMHSRNAVNGSWHLRKYVHDLLVQDIRREWNPRWVNRGKKKADFGELRALQTMPGILVELAFHDNPSEAKALTSPEFRQLTARAIYKGIVNYYAAQHGRKPIYLPETPDHLFARNAGDGKVTVGWKPPAYGGTKGHAAKSYVLYMSKHGKAIGEPIKIKGTQHTLTNLEPNRTYYFRVAATNEGGTSLPSSVVAVRTPSLNPDQQERFLIVDGYDRLDRGLAIIQKQTKPRVAPLGPVRRLFLEQMNNYDYMMEHAEGLAQGAIYFDGATNEAISSGWLKLKDYEGIDWFVGRESKELATLSKKEQLLLKNYLKKGGKLIISGSEIGYDLVAQNKGRQFYEEYLKASFLSDGSETWRIRVDGLNGIAGSLSGPPIGGRYPVPSPDVIRPSNGGQALFVYANNQVAAVRYNEEYDLFHCAFPLEAIPDGQFRRQAFRIALEAVGSIGQGELAEK